MAISGGAWNGCSCSGRMSRRCSTPAGISSCATSAHIHECRNTHVLLLAKLRLGVFGSQRLTIDTTQPSDHFCGAPRWASGALLVRYGALCPCAAHPVPMSYIAQAQDRRHVRLLSQVVGARDTGCDPGVHAIRHRVRDAHRPATQQDKAHMHPPLLDTVLERAWHRGPRPESEPHAEALPCETPPQGCAPPLS